MGMLPEPLTKWRHIINLLYTSGTAYNKLWSMLTSVFPPTFNSSQSSMCIGNYSLLHRIWYYRIAKGSGAVIDLLLIMEKVLNHRNSLCTTETMVCFDKIARTINSDDTHYYSVHAEGLQALSSIKQAASKIWSTENPPHPGQIKFILSHPPASGFQELVATSPIL